MRLLRSVILAISCLALLAGSVYAQTPTAGATRMYAPGTSLTFRMTGGPPKSVQAALLSAAADFSLLAWNNSRTPTFTNSATGTGRIVYTGNRTSPCGTGHADWIQCAAGWGTQDFTIYIRNFATAPMRGWTWCDIALEGVCFDIERAALHEMLHVVMGVIYHDGQGNQNTLMGPATPNYPAATWNTHHIQRCDQAAAQLLYGVMNPYAQYPDCFASIPRAGATGLMPGGQMFQGSTTFCLFTPAVLRGRHALSDIPSAYKALAGTPLAGRTIWFDRKPVTSSVWTLNVASTTTSASPGANWSRAFSTSSGTPISYDFRPHSDAEPGVNAGSYGVTTITWRQC